MCGRETSVTATPVAATTGTCFPLDLIRKYNRPGPRYTSYPTVPQFTTEAVADPESLLVSVRKGTGPLSLYVHLPFCRHLCWFCGCTRIIARQQDKADEYLDYLEKEMRLFQPYLQAGRQVVQLHLGGGTPNFLSPAQIRRLTGLLRSWFEWSDRAEIGVELDPRWLTQEQVAAFHEMGVNRASLGVQDINLPVQQAVNRIQSNEENERAVRWLRAFGIDSLNIDLIYGLPHQSVERFETTLEAVLSYDPDRLAVFSYAHVPWLQPAQQQLEGASLPDGESKIRMLQRIIEKLTSCGYHYIGMDHFAKADDALTRAQRAKSLHRNFQGYSTHAGVEISSFGLSAISQTFASYRQNHKDMKAYYEGIEAGRLPLHRGYILSREDRVRRETIMRLMCDLTLDFEAMSQRLGLDFRTYFSKELASLQPLQDDALVHLSDDRLEVTERGRFFIRPIAMAFDAYLGKSAARYSQAV